MADNGIDGGMYSAWLQLAMPASCPSAPQPIQPDALNFEYPLAYLPVSLDSWFQQQPDPIPRTPPTPMQYVVGTLEPTLILTPNMDTWYCQCPDPIRHKVVPTESVFTQVKVGRPYSPPSDPHESLIPTLDKWFTQSQMPVRRPIEPQLGWWAGVLERTLFETPNMDTWFQQQPDPVRAPLRIPMDQVEPPEWRPLALPTERLTWLRQQPDPIFPHPPVLAGVFVVDPEALMAADATLPDEGEQELLRRQEDTDGTVLRRVGEDAQTFRREEDSIESYRRTH